MLAQPEFSPLAMRLPPDGFLSPLMDPWRQQTRQSAHAWFSLVEDLNRSAIAILPKLNPQTSSDREIGAAAMFGRALQSFEAVILLTERGMLADAGSIARNIVESAIYLGGLSMLDDFPRRMAASNNRHYFTMAESLAHQIETKGCDGETQDAIELRQLLEDVKTQGHMRKSINLRDLAIETEMDGLYDVVYRQLSGDAAHVSLASVERHVARGASGRIERLIFGPQRDGLESILSAATSALLGAMEVLHDVFPIHDIRQAIDEHNARHHSIGALRARRG
ncbi:MAG: DUF5677 domain-containing protein [Achromobacter sp.]|uniref:DUF5677 domain-containing protein n=1 Tax=Achromobacter sp. TaxID=134375 RepID=UPI003D065D53